MKLKQAAAEYVRIFGSPPQVAVRAPGRVNLLGEHVDYAGGFVLPAAIDKAVWLVAGVREDGRLEFRAADLQDSFSAPPGEIRRSEKTWANYLLGVASEARKDGHRLGGLNVVFGGDVPQGAGLSSSAALECAVAFALNRLFDLKLEKMDLVRLAQRGENRFVGVNCGIMDMFASVMGQADSVVRLDCRSLEFEHIPFDAPDHALLLCDTGVRHSLGASPYNARRAECEEGLRILQNRHPQVLTLRDASPDLVLQEKQAGAFAGKEKAFSRCLHVVSENERVLQACEALRAQDFQRFGGLMFDSHESLKNLYEVSCPELDLLVDAARSFNQAHPAGVAGARMMGGGFGGCTINLVRRELAPQFLEHLDEVFLEKFGRTVESHAVKLCGGVGRRSFENQLCVACGVRQNQDLQDCPGFLRIDFEDFQD